MFAAGLLLIAALEIIELDTRLEANAAAVAAPATYAECLSSRHGKQYFASLNAAHMAWDGTSSMNCREMRNGWPTGIELEE